MKLSGNTLQEGIENLKRLRAWKPFKYSGRWHIAMIGDQCKAMRTLSDLKKAAVKAGMREVEIATLKREE